MSASNRTASAHERAHLLELLWRQGVADPGEAGLQRALGWRVAVAILLLLGQVWVSMQIRSLGYEGEALGRVIHRLDQERVELEDAVARESRPSLLASRAIELGMKKPGRGQLRRIDAKP